MIVEIISDKDEVKLTDVSYKDYQSEYKKFVNYGASGQYDETTKSGEISSFRKQVLDLESKGFRNLNLENGGDDDILIVDPVRKEFGMFEFPVPNKSEIDSAANLISLWEIH